MPQFQWTNCMRKSAQNAWSLYATQGGGKGRGLGGYDLRAVSIGDLSLRGNQLGYLLTSVRTRLDFRPPSTPQLSIPFLSLVNLQNYSSFQWSSQLQTYIPPRTHLSTCQRQLWISFSTLFIAQLPTWRVGQ